MFQTIINALKSRTILLGLGGFLVQAEPFVASFLKMDVPTLDSGARNVVAAVTFIAMIVTRFAAKKAIVSQTPLA